MGERKSALLTSSQREFLFNRRETDNPAHNRAMRSRLRNRVYDGFLDGDLLWQWLDADDRRHIFEAWQGAGDDIDEGVGSEVLGTYDSLEERERERFGRALVSLVAFIYTAADESGHFDGESIITDGVATAEDAMGNHYDVSLEYTEMFDLEELRDRYERGDPDMTVRQLQYLQDEGEITQEERDQFFSKAVDSLDDVADWFGPQYFSDSSEDSDDG